MYLLSMCSENHLSTVVEIFLQKSLLKTTTLQHFSCFFPAPSSMPEDQASSSWASVLTFRILFSGSWSHLSASIFLSAGPSLFQEGNGPDTHSSCKALTYLLELCLPHSFCQGPSSYMDLQQRKFFLEPLPWWICYLGCSCSEAPRILSSASASCLEALMK